MVGCKRRYFVRGLSDTNKAVLAALYPEALGLPGPQAPSPLDQCIKWLHKVEGADASARRPLSPPK